MCLLQQNRDCKCNAECAQLNMLLCTQGALQLLQLLLLLLSCIRPVLLLGGELDGQMRWPWQAPLAADAAVLAQKAGPW